MKKQPAVYLLSNRPNGTLYTGVTRNITQKAKIKLVESENPEWRDLYTEACT